jgi:integrase
MSDSTPAPDPRKAARPRKPKKPYPDFPLTPHNCGAWQKKIRGRTYYFGRWGRIVNGEMERIPGDGWEAALEEYRRVADDLHAGRTPRVNWDQLSVAELCNRFLTAKLRKVESGEIGLRTFHDYKDVTDLIVSQFGKARPVVDLTAADFEALRARMARRAGPVRLGNLVGRIKGVFKYALDNGLIEKPVRFGSEFRKPDKAVLRRHRAQRGERMLEAGELRTLIAAAELPLKAMILLGINCGFGNTDCASLPLSAVNLDAAWIDFPRPKTGVPRRCPLWPETVAALREALARRPAPKAPAAAGRVFVSQQGAVLIGIRQTGRWDMISRAFGALLRGRGLYRDGLGFYTLRHVFRTVADAARDPVAIDLIMGHSDPSMAAYYRERIDDARLAAVTEHVRQWLFGDDAGGRPEEPKAAGPEVPGPEVLGPDVSPPEGGERPALRLYVG